MVKSQGDFHFSFGTSTKRSEQPQGDFFALQREPWTIIFLYNISLYDDFLIGLVISPRVSVLAWGKAEGQYSYPWTNNKVNTEINT